VSRFFIDHPIVAQVLAILTMIGGAVMIFRLPIAQFPEIAPRQIQTTATYTGADALTVEQSVATPIDEQVNGAKRMIYMQAISANDGTMTFQVSFDVDSNIDMDQVQVQNRLAQAQANLPAAVNAYGLTTIQTAGFPLLVFTMTSPNHTWDQTFLSNYLAINVQDELARVPGIGQVRIFGASNYAMRVWVSPATIANMGLTVTDLVNAIAAQNVVNPAGQIGGEPVPPGQQLTYTVRARGRLMNAEEFGDIVVRANADGSFVRLKDVARIELGGENYNMQAYTNGAPAALFALYQVPGSNALEVANRVKSAMARLAERFPSDMRTDLTLDTTIPVTEGAKEILITLAEAIGLVLLVVFVFLGRRGSRSRPSRCPWSAPSSSSRCSASRSTRSRSSASFWRSDSSWTTRSSSWRPCRRRSTRASRRTTPRSPPWTRWAARSSASRSCSRVSSSRRASSSASPDRSTGSSLSPSRSPSSSRW